MGTEDAEALNRAPLRGVLLCCTSILPDQRVKIVEAAQQMGAQCTNDLVAEVTHLIVGDWDTPKYRYVAKERWNVKCLLPEWVDAVRHEWLKGETIDLPALEELHKVKPFWQLHVCLTGFQDLAQRKHIETTVRNNGGVYCADLSKEATHLIVQKPSGAKYDAAKEWGGIKIVTIEWMEQCVERGMTLEDTFFDPLMPPEKRGQGAWIRPPAQVQSPKKRPLEGAAMTGGPRKLRRSASSRLSSQKEEIWHESLTNPHIEMSTKPRDQWAENEVQPTKTDDAARLEKITAGAPMVRTLLNKRKDPKTEQKQLMFANRVFATYGMEEAKRLIAERVLKDKGAEILEDVAALNAYTGTRDKHLLVLHTTTREMLPKVELLKDITIVTDFWLEKCLQSTTAPGPSTRVLYSPLQTIVPDLAKELKISCSGFEDIELLHFSKTIKLIGATYEPEFTPNTSILVCWDAQKHRPKVQKALVWGVPAVNADWLWTMLREQRIPDTKHYLVFPEIQANQLRKVSPTNNDNQARSSPTRQVPRENEQKRASSANRAISRPPRLQQNGRTSLKEISANISPQPSASPPKPLQGEQPELSATENNSVPSDKAVTETLVELLAQQRNRESLAERENVILTRSPRKSLFGRSISDLSGRSNSNSNLRLSRGSSIDTLNTDGVGTPLIEAISPSRPRTGAKKHEVVQTTTSLPPLQGMLTAELLQSAEDEHAMIAAEEKEKARSQLQMTQVGYGDNHDESAMQQMSMRRTMTGDSISFEEAMQMHDEMSKQGQPDDHQRLRYSRGLVDKRTEKPGRRRSGLRSAI